MDVLLWVQVACLMSLISFLVLTFACLGTVHLGCSLSVYHSAEVESHIVFTLSGERN